MKKSAKKSKAARTKTALNTEIARDHASVVVQLNQITATRNPRDKLENIEELAASIKASGGLLQPLVIARAAKGWELIAGARRLAALKLLGAKDAPARIIERAQAEFDVLRLMENLQRDNLSGWETCKAIHALLPQFATQKKLAEAVGKNEGYISKCVAVVNMKPEVARVQDLALRELFSLLASSATARTAAGPVAGGRFVNGAIQLRNSDTSGRFSLRINFDPERTPAETRTRILETLKELIARLERSPS